MTSVQIQVMTALVSFDRVFEVLDLKPLISERPGAVPLPKTETGNGTGVAPDRADASAGVLHDVSFTAPTSQLKQRVARGRQRVRTVGHSVDGGQFPDVS
jgi:ATP-binding cassette, subfamily B, bacterial